MSYLTYFLLAVALSIDNFAVSVSCSTTMRPFRVNDAFKLSSLFGVIQALMLVLGWLGGNIIKIYISTYGQLIGSVILFLIGIKMIYEAFYRKTEVKISSLNYSVILMLAVATSIDALVVGISFTFLNVPIFEPAFIVGCVTLFMSFCGANLGCRLGHFFGNGIEILGGLILVGIGIHSLILNF